jgi:hypothetical protein
MAWLKMHWPLRKDAGRLMLTSSFEEVVGRRRYSSRVESYEPAAPKEDYPTVLQLPQLAYHQLPMLLALSSLNASAGGNLIPTIGFRRFKDKMNDSKVNDVELASLYHQITTSWPRNRCVGDSDIIFNTILLRLRIPIKVVVPRFLPFLFNSKLS